MRRRRRTFYDIVIVVRRRRRSIIIIFFSINRFYGITKKQVEKHKTNYYKAVGIDAETWKLTKKKKIARRYGKLVR